ncbi:DNA topoisomerase, partial [Campylobacter vulpis]
QKIFTATQSKTTKSGFRSLWKNIDTDKEEELDSDKNEYDLSSLKDNDNAKCALVQIEKKQTKPRPYYTMTTLLKDLNSVAKYVSDEKIKKLLMEKDKDKKGESGGIGTPATRSNHIKTLIEREYIEVSKDKKQVVKSTQKGRDLIALSPKALTTPDMTALWFEQQKMIEAQELTRGQFLEEVTKEVIGEIQRISNNKDFKILEDKNQQKIQCPQCDKGYLIKRKGKYGDFWGCSEYKEGCKAIYPDNKGKPNFETKQNNSDTTYKCPQCDKGFLQRMKSKNGKSWWWGCNEFKQGCKAMYYDDNGKPKI